MCGKLLLDVRATATNAIIEILHLFYMIDIKPLKSCTNKPYAILGAGGYASRLLKKIESSGLPRPEKIYTFDAKELLYSKVRATLFNPESHIKDFIIGSSVYQGEIIDKFHSAVPKIYWSQYNLWDVSPDDFDNWSYYNLTLQKKYFIIFSVNPSEHSSWLVGLALFFKRYGVDILYRHPLQEVSNEFLLNSIGVALWNGTTRAFSLLKIRLSKLKIDFTYIECGFFPQKDFYYFDKQGININSQLSSDDLSWLPSDYEIIVEKLRNEFFNLQDSQIINENFIFVPLQLQSDSNVLFNSKFTNGMQEFIEYIESIYPDERLVFKAHPKDCLADSYKLKSGEWSTEDSRRLVLSAKSVHGINSSVLFEAALAGKPVIAEGSCLLRAHHQQQDKLIAAMLIRQFHINDTLLSSDILKRFSYIKGEY